MANPYRVTPAWPQLGDIKPGAAIGIIPDGKGGTWLHHRSEPPILHITPGGHREAASATACSSRRTASARTATATSGRATAVRSRTTRPTNGRGLPVVQVQPRGQGAAVAGQGRRVEGGHRYVHRPDGLRDRAQRRLIVADGHWPRPTDAQQDGDRLVRLKTDGTFVASYGKMGAGPGEFMGPHALAFDSQGRLFVADGRTTASRCSTATCSSWTSGGTSAGRAASPS